MAWVIVTLVLFALVIGGGAVIARRDRRRRLPADTSDNPMAADRAPYGMSSGVSGKSNRWGGWY